MDARAVRIEDDERERAMTDALAGACERDVAESQDAPHGGEEPRELRFPRERAERRAERLERALAGPHAAAVYRRLVLRSDLPDGVARLLCILTEEWGRQLTNCYPGRRRIARKMGGLLRLAPDASTEHVRRAVWSVDKRLAHAVRERWLRRVPLTRDALGGWVEAVGGGRFISAVGCQFCIPPDVLAPGHLGWAGPRIWTTRRFVREARRER